MATNSARTYLDYTLYLFLIISKVHPPTLPRGDVGPRRHVDVALRQSGLGGQRLAQPALEVFLRQSRLTRALPRDEAQIGRAHGDCRNHGQIEIAQPIALHAGIHKVVIDDEFF